jgi:phage terminase small subunit
VVPGVSRRVVWGTKAKRGGDVARLTEKQKRFVAEYLVDLNATQAAIRAGYSEKTAGQIGEQNLKKLEIREALQKAMAKRAERTEITQDMVIRELAAIGFAKATDYAQVDDRGLVRITPTEELSDVQRRALSGIKEGKYGVEVSSYDKVRALELLGKHLGMFDARMAQQQEQENNLVERLLGGTEEDMDTDDVPEVE